MYVRPQNRLQVLRVPRARRGLSGLGCGSCAGKCGSCPGKRLGDFTDIIDSLTPVLQTTLPVIVNDTLGPGSVSPTYTVNPSTGQVISTAGLTAAQIASLNAANAQAIANAAASSSSSSFNVNGTVNIGGYNVPVWALGAGALGVVLVATR